MQDVGYWERRGVQSVAVTTTAFLRQASQQLQDLGLNGVCYACVPHPIQGLSSQELVERMNEIFPKLLLALQTDVYESPLPGPKITEECGS
mmetsp:Transcript_60376/g.110831  ORF Transcript_60376/g.110831 Transcript_60376/m.110831 type:complete len:91 (+) Transcript_60376:156-428(+)